MLPMAVLSPEDGGPSGPGQRGRACNGQCVYWIIMSQPTPAVLASHRLKRPEDFSREQLSKLMVKVHQECDVTLAELLASWMGPHASGLMHHNCLARADAQYRWKKLIQAIPWLVEKSDRTYIYIYIYTCWLPLRYLSERGNHNYPPLVPTVVLFASISCNGSCREVVQLP